jgi:hypothetical protein
MPTKDGFAPDHPLPVFLSEYAEEFEQPGMGKAWDGAAISSRILKMSVLAVAAMAIAILWLGNPVALFANVTASLVDMTALQPGVGQSTPAIQSTAQALPPAATDAPTREEIAAPVEPANRIKAENSEPPAEDVLKQFQTWAAEEDTRAPVVPVQPVQSVQPAQVVQDDQAQVEEDARAPKDPARTKCAGGDPARAESPSEAPAGAKCTGIGPARTRCTSAGPVRAKCPATPGTVVAAKLGFATLDLAGSV